MQQKQLKNKGSALIIVLTTMILFMIIGAALMQLGFGQRVLAAQRSAENLARCAADAGVSKAVALRNKNKTVVPASITGESLPACDAAYDVTFPDPNGYKIVSVGKSNNNRTSRTIKVELRLKGLYEFGVFGDNEITMRNSAVADLWNNGAPGYLQIGTNASDAMIKSGKKNGATIDGDFYLGYGSDTEDLAGNSAIDGSVYSLPAPVILESVPTPTGLPSIGAINTSGQLIDGSCSIDSITLNSNGNVLSIDSATNAALVEIYVLGDVTFGAGSNLIIDPNHAVNLYLGGNAVFKNTFTGGSDPTKLRIFGLDTCTSIRFDNGAKTYAAVYAPKAEITAINSSEIYGAIVGNTITIDNSAKVHYDAYLKNVSLFDIGAKFVVKTWQEE